MIHDEINDLITDEMKHTYIFIPRYEVIYLIKVEVRIIKTAEAYILSVLLMSS